MPGVISRRHKVLVDPDALAWANIVPASGAQVARVSALIRGLKADGVWSSLDRLWLFAAENSTQARRDLVARVAAAAQNGPTFAANRGYTGDALSAYIDTGFDPSTAGGKYTQNDAHFGVWVETADSGNSRAKYMGNNFAAQYSVIGQYTDVSQAENSINTTSGPGGTAYGVKTGHWHIQRTSSIAAADYRNAVQFNTYASGSAAPPSGSFFVLCADSLGTPNNFVNGRVSAAHIGKSLTAGQIAAFYNRLRIYMTAVGVS